MAVKGEHFHFVASGCPGDRKDRLARRLAKSHAVKNALEKKRQKGRAQFNVRTIDIETHKPSRKTAKVINLHPLLIGPSEGTLDPFQSLPVDTPRLQILLQNNKARKAPEPVFSVMEELNFQSFRSVFRTGAADAALLNAIMLSLAFAATEQPSTNRECLDYRGQAIGHVREKIESLDNSVSEPTIGAILLLAGVEAQFGTTAQVQLHMNAIKNILEMCRSRSVYLTGGIKRAIFWQDLHSAILSGSERIVDHTTFVELHWTRDPFVPSFFELPRGFDARSHLCSVELLDIIKDVNALQCIRDAPGPFHTKRDVTAMAHINNHIASIQSRLVGLRTQSPAAECCRLALYMSSIMLCCTIWCSMVVPEHIAAQLLCNLQQTTEDQTWDYDYELLVWICYIGGAFVESKHLREEYVKVLRSASAKSSMINASWPNVLEILREFIWSQRAFEVKCKAMWQEAKSTM